MASILHGASTSGSTTASAVTFNALALPTATGRNKVAYAFQVTADSYILSVVAGGQSATMRHRDVNTSPAPDMRVEIWDVTGVTGTSPNVVVTLASGDGDISVQSYGLYDAGAVADTDSLTGSGATIALTGLTVPTGGVAVFGWSSNLTGACTWTNATEAPSSDATVGGDRHCGAYNSTAGTNTITADGSTGQQIIAGVAWGSAYFLTANVQNVAVAGQSVALRLNRRLTAGVKNAAVDDQTTALRAARKLIAGVKNVAVDDVSTSLNLRRRLTANVDDVAVTGQLVDLTYNSSAGYILEIPAAGEVTVAGQSANAKVGRRLSVTKKDIAATGQSVALRSARKLAATVRNATASGQSVSLRAGRRLTAGVRNVSITGLPGDLVVYRLEITRANVTLTGRVVSFGSIAYTLTPLTANVTVRSSNVRVDRLFKLIGRSPVVASPTRAGNVTQDASLGPNVITSPTRPTQITG
jgi:hypothetical protein